MKIITINEESHGYVGLAKNYYSAVAFLLSNGWLTEYDEVWDELNSKWVRVCDILGENWVDKILSWDIGQFNEFFYGCINLEETQVYEYTREE